MGLARNVGDGGWEALGNSKILSRNSYKGFRTLEPAVKKLLEGGYEPSEEVKNQVCPPVQCFSI